MNKLFTLSLLALASALPSHAAYNPTPASQLEKLSRGLVVVSSSEGKFASWRFLGTDDDIRTSFRLYRDGVEIYASSANGATSYLDKSGTSSSVYSLVSYYDGVKTDSVTAKPWTNPYFQLHLDRPADGSNSEGTYSYTPNDCSVGDVDGDGEYEIIVKWDPSNAKDNSQGGYTGNVYLDCYRLSDIYKGGEGATPEKLWRIDLGVNIRAGAHYTQFMVYDFDGDGKAELICKTGPGSKDGKGNYVNQAATDATIKGYTNTTDFRNSAGRVNGGQEYLTVFNGETGAAVHTIFYQPNRNADVNGGGDAAGTFDWEPGSKTDNGSYGNRGERYLAAVAYLDGPASTPSGIFCRGYYGYAFLWAVDFDGQKLYPRWLSSNKANNTATLYAWDREGKRTQSSQTGLKPTSSDGIGSGTMYGNGNHNLSVGDVDGDGCDEIVWGSATLDNDGRVLCATGFGHGDAIHLGKFIPGREGLQIFQVHEDKLKYAWDLHDPATGEILFQGGPEGVDNGRGICGHFLPGYGNAVFSSASERAQRSCLTGSEVSSKGMSTNGRIYWDGDLYEEFLDGNQIDKLNSATSSSRLYINGNKNFWDFNGSSSCNGTKKTPNLSGDIFGDWREELVLWSSVDNATLNIFSTTTTTSFRLPTLMHDHLYRMGIAWQNVAYNQPPHLGYYPQEYTEPWVEFLSGNDEGKTWSQTVALGDSIVPISMTMHNLNKCQLDSCYYPDGTASYYTATGFKRTWTYNIRNFLIAGKPQMAGDYVFKITAQNTATGFKQSYYFTLHVVDTSSLASLLNESHAAPDYYTLSGRRVGRVSYSDLPRGLYIVKQGGKIKKIFKK